MNEKERGKALERFEDMVKADMRNTGSTRREAVAKVGSKHPVLHKIYVRGTQATSYQTASVGRAPTSADLAVEDIETSGGDAVGVFNSLVQSAMARGLGRKEAVAQVAKSNKRAHRAYLEATNAPDTVDVIRSKFRNNAK